jgi:hypothetical protein
VYPNPVTDQLVIKSGAAADLNDKHVSVYNVFGKVVISKLLTSQTNTIRVAGLPAGVYVVQIGEGGQGKIFKIVKE